MAVGPVQLGVIRRRRIGAFVHQLAEDIRSDAVGSIAVINARFEGKAVRKSLSPRRSLVLRWSSGACSVASAMSTDADVVVKVFEQERRRSMSAAQDAVSPALHEGQHPGGMR